MFQAHPKSHAATTDLHELDWTQRAASALLGVAASTALIGSMVLALPEPAQAAASPVAAAPNDGDEPASTRLQRYALNVLMVPVLDETVPPRWTASLGAMRCAKGSQVWVDGQPLQRGALVPARSFTLRWKMVDCRPTGPHESFNGDVSMTVYHEETGYSAMVVPTSLRVKTVDSTSTWTRPFSVVMP